MVSCLNPATCYWFVLRDLKRSNAKNPAYRQLAEQGFEVFTPLQWKLVTRQGRPVREQVPYLPDLLFVHSTLQQLNPVVERTVTLQYRYVRGGGYCQPLTVREADMERFIHAVLSTDSPRYYSPDEITPDMYGNKVQIVGGPLDGYEGHLLKVRGTRKRRLLVELPHSLTASVEVMPEYIWVLL